jgi:hypothetical protein
MQIIEYLVERRPPHQSNHIAYYYYEEYKHAHGICKYIQLSFCWFFITYRKPKRTLFAQYFSSLYNNESNNHLKKIWKNYYLCYATKWKKKDIFVPQYSIINLQKELYKQWCLPPEIQTIIFDYYYSLNFREFYAPLLRQISSFRISRYVGVRDGAVIITVLFLLKNFKVSRCFRIS